MAHSLLSSLAEAFNEETLLLCLQTAETSDKYLRRAGAAPIPLETLLKLNRSSIGKGCHPTEAARTEVESTFAESAEYLAGRHLTVIPGLTDEADAAAGRIARETRLRLDRLAELLWDVAQRQDHGSLSTGSQQGIDYAQVLHLAYNAGFTDLEIENTFLRCRALFDPTKGETETFSVSVDGTGRLLKSSKNNAAARVPGKPKKRRVQAAISLSNLE